MAAKPVCYIASAVRNPTYWNCLEIDHLNYKGNSDYLTYMANAVVAHLTCKANVVLCP